MVNVRTATSGDVNSFALREDDILEVWSIARAEAKQALLMSYESSRECWVGEVEGNIVCLFGLIPEGTGAAIWLLFTEIESLPLSFFRKAKTVVNEALEHYEYIENYAHQDKTFILKLSKWLGFTVDEAQPFGIDQEFFHRVHKRRI